MADQALNIKQAHPRAAILGETESSIDSTGEPYFKTLKTVVLDV